MYAPHSYRHRPGFMCVPIKPPVQELRAAPGAPNTAPAAAQAQKLKSDVGEVTVDTTSTGDEDITKGCAHATNPGLKSDHHI